MGNHKLKHSIIPTLQLSLRHKDVKQPIPLRCTQEIKKHVRAGLPDSTLPPQTHMGSQSTKILATFISVFWTQIKLLGKGSMVNPTYYTMPPNALSLRSMPQTAFVLMCSRRRLSVSRRTALPVRKPESACAVPREHRCRWREDPATNSGGNHGHQHMCWNPQTNQN